MKKRGKTRIALKHKLALELAEERFAQEFAADLDVGEAYIRAFPNSTRSTSRRAAGIAGSLLLRKPLVRARVQEICAEKIDRTKTTVDWVVAKLREVHARCMQAQPVLDEEGQPIGVYVFDSKGALKALELLGKHTGAIAPDAHLHLNNNQQNNYYGVVMMPGFQDVEAPNLPPPEERTTQQKMVAAPRLQRLPGKIQEAFLNRFGHSLGTHLGEQNGESADHGGS